MANINNSDDDSRFIQKDYSIGGGVTMKRSDFQHGFKSDDLNDRIRGTMGTRRGEHFGKGPRNWKRTDEAIMEDVCEILYFDPHVDASDIEVSVEEGLVCLQGWVNSREEKREVERCVEQISGVHDIRNELHMRNRRAS